MSLRTSYVNVMGRVLPLRRDPDPTVRALANSAHFAARSVWGHLSLGRQVTLGTVQNAFYRLWNHIRRVTGPVAEAYRGSDASNAFIRDAAMRNRRLRRSRARSRRVRRLVRRPSRWGFGQTEIVEEIVEEVLPTPATGMAMALGVGTVVLLGMGFYYGLTTKSYTGRRVYRGAV